MVMITFWAIRDIEANIMIQKYESGLWKYFGTYQIEKS